jgi:hypothetical protein
LQATNRVELNDEAVLEAARLFKRTKELGTGMLGVPTGTLPRLPPAPKFRKHQRRVPATKGEQEVSVQDERRLIRTSGDSQRDSQAAGVVE